VETRTKLRKVQSYGKHVEFAPLFDPDPGRGAQVRGAGGEPGGFSATLVVTAEPRWSIDRVVGATVTEAVDDRGRSLRADGPEMPPAAEARDGGFSVPVTLAYPADPGRSIKRLKGVVSLEASGGDAQVALRARVHFDWADVPMP